MYCILALLSSALANSSPPPPHPSTVIQTYESLPAGTQCLNLAGWGGDMRIKPIYPQLPVLKYQWSPALHQGLMGGKHVDEQKASSGTTPLNSQGVTCS